MRNLHATFKNTKGILLGLLLCLVCSGTGWAAGEKCAANTTWGGFKTVIATKGTDGYYEIDTPEKLAWFSCEITKTNTASQKTNAKLMRSIDLQGKLFIPISAGKGTPSFGGIFDGQGFTIKNLFIDASEIVKSTNGGDAKYAQNIGLFAALKGGTIKNVTLTNVEIYAASSAGDAGTNGADNPISVGAVAGYLESGTITGCAVSGKIETSGATNRVGGIAGNVWAATVLNCISDADVIATGNNTHVGGILGAVRKDGDVTINSCVYAGETLFSGNGSVGAVVGNYEKNKDITTNDLYYSADYPAVGTGLGSRPFNSTQADNLNTEDVICELNGGSWNTNEGTCSEPTNGVWSEGQNDLSMNGSDGYKVTFDPNGGAFPEGAKTVVFFAKNASITANEIENPTFSGNKFAGWSLTQGGAAVQNLGVADKAKTIYAVWKPIRTITFKTNPGTFVGGSNEASKNVAEGDVVTVEGLPALPERFCSQGAEPQCGKYAYFNGWSTESHNPYGENDVIPEGTIVDLPTFVFNENTTLYAVWVESETYTVTFNANEHGQTKVAFVKVAKHETTVEPPNPEADDGYVFTNRWCEVVPCTDDTKFNFETKIERNYVLYADWSVPNYDITYIIDGEPNTETGNPAEYNVQSATVTLAKPERAGYVFDGWYDEDGNKATTILSGSTGDRTFHASWVPVTYKITYLADNTLSLTTESDVKQHGVAKQLKGATYAHGGCIQDGWSKASYDKDGYNLDYAVNGSYEEDKDVILFPHWNCGTYNITYEIYGMSVTNRNPDQYTGPAKITLENAFDPAKKYFFMDQWYKEPTFKTVIRDIQDIDADLTVYAKWYNKITYKPGKNVSGAKNVEEKKYFDTTYTFKSSIDKYVRAGYTLDGWSTTDGGEKVYDLGEQYATNENLTLYPHWIEGNVDVKHYGAVTIYTYEDGHKEAVVNGDYKGTDAVNIPNDIEVSSVTFNRTFNNKASTLTLPFEIDVSNVSGARFYNFNGIEIKDDGKRVAKMKRIWEGTLEANKPYAVRPPVEDPSASTISFEGAVTFKKTVSPVTRVGDYEFRGTLAYTTVTADMIASGTIYGFTGKNVDGVPSGTFARFLEGSWFLALRAYIKKVESAVPNGAPRMMAAPMAKVGLNSQNNQSLEYEIEWDENEDQPMIVRKVDKSIQKIQLKRNYDIKGRSVKGQHSSRNVFFSKKVIVK